MTLSIYQHLPKGCQLNLKALKDGDKSHPVTEPCFRHPVTVLNLGAKAPKAPVSCSI